MQLPHLPSGDDTNIPSVQADLKAVQVDRNKRGVLLDVTQFVESPEGVIPSFVGVERAKQRPDFRRQVLETVDAVVDEFYVAAEGKVSEVLIGKPARNRNCVGHLVEAGAKIRDCVEDDAWEFVSKEGMKLHLENFCRAIRLKLNGEGRVSFVCVDGVEALAQIANVVLSATERAFRAGE